MTSTIDKPHLMAFHACDTGGATDCNDPTNHQVYLAQSEHGDTWTVVPDYTPFRGSVPDVIRRGDTIYLFSTTGVRRFNMTTNAWSAVAHVSIKNPAGGEQLFVDPSLIVENGKLVMFFLAGELGTDPARCATSDAPTTCVKTFYSATEVEGSDGTQFTLDSGSRLALTITDASSASDPDVFKDTDGYVLYVSRGNSVEAYRSTELRGTYVAVSASPFVQNLGGVATGRALLRSNEYWTFIQSTNADGRTYIRGGEHGSLTSSIAERVFEVVLTGESMGLSATTSIGSPGLALNEE